MDKPDLAGTVLQHRIDSIASESPTKRTKYSLKSTQTLNRNAHLFNEDQLAFIREQMKDFFLFWGYVENKQDPDNNTPFFAYDDLTPEDLEKYNGFKKHNAVVLANLGKGDKRAFKFLNDAKIDMVPPNVCVRDRITIKM